MRTRAIATILSTAALIGLAVPAGAGAAKIYHQRPAVSFELSGSGTHGFSFDLFGSEGAAYLTVDKDLGLGIQAVSYLGFQRHPRPALDRGHLDLKIGKLGHFRGEFVVKSVKTQKLEDECTSEPTKIEEGYFAGSFVFHGERGYTSIHAPRENGSITRRGAATCRITTPERGRNGRRAEEKAETTAEEHEFRLLAGDPKENVLLQASREQDPAKPKSAATTIFEVSARDGHAGPYRIYRSAVLLDTDRAAGSTFLTPNTAEPQAEATLEPPAPFSGSATFRLEGPKTASWTGDLAVELPGRGKLPLTGNKIYAGVCSGGSNCTKTLPWLLGELLEAGGGFTGGSISGLVSG